MDNTERIYNQLYKLRGKYKLSEDDMQDIQLRVLEKVDIDEALNLEALISVITKRFIYDKWRDEKRKPSHIPFSQMNYNNEDNDYNPINHMLASNEFSADRDIKNSELSEELSQALSDLSELELDIVHNFFIKNMKLKDIADKYNINYNTVKVTSHKLRKELQKKLKKSF